ncbi:MAG: BON domain-containing protein [Gammaproteobacteria bacterium]|nr:MAG: BON domain-containing protein [Gammaproteobacteria bacterium]
MPLTPSRSLLLTLPLLAALLGGCAAVVVGGTATVAGVAHDRRTVGTVIEDKEILIKAMRLRAQDEELKRLTNIDITVYNLQVLLTGQAANPAVVERFAQQVARIPRVRRVYNEVTIGAESTWSDAAADAYLTSRVKLALFDVGIEGFDPLRVKVVSSGGTVYLMGLLTPTEADAVTGKVRYISGVKKVVKLFEYV